MGSGSLKFKQVKRTRPNKFVHFGFVGETWSHGALTVKRGEFERSNAISTVSGIV